MSKREPYELRAKEDAAPIFWKSLEQKADMKAAAERATAEFPRETVGSDFSLGPVGRRGFVLGGIAGALATLEGCARRPVENLLPYAKAPEYQLPGMPVHYASVITRRGDAIGIVVESHDGRPTKIAGNHDHPSSAGGLDAIGQATILDLYDPDRSTSPRKGTDPAKWDDVLAALKDKANAFAADGGAKLRILMRPTLSPTVMRLRDAVTAKYPHARFHTWAPVNESNVREGTRIAFGEPAVPFHDFGMARVVLALDSDFLGTEPGMIRASKTFSHGRRLIRGARDAMSRLYVVEPSYTNTGANADHRLRLPARQIEAYVIALAHELSSRPGIDLSSVSALFASAPATVDGVSEKWIKSVADELTVHRARGIITLGSRQPARLHALVQAMNVALQNGGPGSPVSYFPAIDQAEPEVGADLKALAADIDGGRVDTLIILGGNPVHDAPADLKIADKLAKVGTTIHLSDRVDETSVKCTWHLPLAHELEAWGDARSVDGTLSVQQPMIAPLFGGKSELEILALLAGDPGTPYDLVRATIKAGSGTLAAFEQSWKTALHKGIFPGTTGRPLPTLTPRGDQIVAAFPRVPPPPPISAQNLEVTFAPDPKLFDGRYGNNPWLLELPDLMTKIVWDNAACVSPSTAKELGVVSGEVVTLSNAVGSIEIPVWVMPGQADHSIALNLGWGRNAGRYSTSAQQGPYGSDANPLPQPQKAAGFDVYPLRGADSLGFGDGVKLAKTGKTYTLVQTQEHQSMEGRPIAIDTTIDEYRKNPEFTKYRSPDPKILPLWKPVNYDGHKWGMVIDLSACTGCDACIIACQAENNIATVGKEQVYRNREMYWIRIDRYFLGENENDPQVALQPVACVQCEQAPCENVCPVNATSHSPEGLNDMAYNRCIGTRYCANNCPYKVRRFNYLEFEGGPIGSSAATVYGDIPETRKMQFNPDVTVRMRGVMEKCTYCVQRIQETKIAARREERPIRDGEITPACAETCPADAIIFGDLNDPQSHVARWSKFDRSYHLLSELGTHPRTTYLGKIRNPNPAMGEG